MDIRTYMHKLCTKRVWVACTKHACVLVYIVLYHIEYIGKSCLQTGTNPARTGTPAKATCAARVARTCCKLTMEAKWVPISANPSAVCYASFFAF